MLPNSGYEVSAFAQILDTLGLSISAIRDFQNLVSLFLY